MKINPTLEKLLLCLGLILIYTNLIITVALEKGWWAVLINVFVPVVFFSGIFLILIWIFWDKFKEQEEEQKSQP